MPRRNSLLLWILLALLPLCAQAQGLNPNSFGNSVFSGTITGTYTLGGTPTLAQVVTSQNLTGTVSQSDFNVNQIIINGDAVNNTGGGVNWLRINGNVDNISWAQNTAYTVGLLRDNLGNTYTQTIASCTSSAVGTGPSGTGSGIIDGTCSWDFLQAAWAGKRTGIYSTMNIRSQSSSSSDALLQLQGGYFNTAITAPQGGTSPTSGSSAGFAYGMGTQVNCTATATNLSGCVGAEIDMGLAGTAARNVGLQIIANSNNSAHGNDTDAFLTFGSAVSGGQPLNGILFQTKQSGNAFSIDPTGTLIGSQLPFAPASHLAAVLSPKAATGIDFSNIYLSSSQYLAGASSRSAVGTITVGPLSLTPAAGGTTIDTTLQTTNTPPTISAAGTNYFVGDQLFGTTTVTGLTTPWQGHVTTTNNGGGPGTVTAIATDVPGYGTSCPAGAKAISGGSGAGLTLTFACTAPASVTLGGTAKAFVATAGTVAAVEGVLFQSALPFIVAPTGSMANNGADTLGTALPNAYPNSYMFLPANAIVAGSAAGWYYTTCSTTTACIHFNNTYTSGQPAIPASPTAFATTGPGAFTGVITTQTAYSTTIAANTLGIRDGLRLSGEFSHNNTAGTKTESVSVGGTGFISGSVTTTATWNPQAVIRNRDALNVQTGTTCAAASCLGTAVGNANIFAAVDFGAQQTIAATVGHGTATDVAVLEGLTVELVRSAQ